MRFNRLIPEFAVRNLQRSLAFYRMLGFQIEYERPEERFAFLSFQGGQLMLEQGGWGDRVRGPRGRGMHLQLQVRRLAPVARRLRKARWPLLARPRVRWHRKGRVLMGSRQLIVQDPDGYVLRLFEDAGRRLLKAPG